MSSHKSDNNIQNIRIWLPGTAWQRKFIWYEKIGVLCTRVFMKKNNKGVRIFYVQEYQRGSSDWEANLLGGSSYHWLGLSVKIKGIILAKKQLCLARFMPPGSLWTQH